MGVASRRIVPAIGVLVAGLALTVAPAGAASGDITTVAGGGRLPLIDGIAATSARITPHDVVADGVGNLYIADDEFHKVRRVDAATGNMTTTAGRGSVLVGNDSGDGGQATLAELNFPRSLALHGDVLYIADSDNNKVRAVDLPTGVITTYAGHGRPGFSGDGGPAIDAQFRSVHDLAVDADGNLFVADLFNFRIRRIDAATGVITTVVGGGGSAPADGALATNVAIDPPQSVAVGPDGTIHFTDSQRVWRVNGDGTLSTVAGTGSQGFSGDGGPATSAKLSNPSQLAFDGDGRLHISDRSNRRVRRVNTDGTIVTVAGNGTNGSAGDGGPATSASLSFPLGLSFGPDGDLFVADHGGLRVRAVEG